MNETELYKELGVFTKNKDKWKESIPYVSSLLHSSEPLLRERAVNAFGRIGRGDFIAIQPYWHELFRFASDEDSKFWVSAD